MSEDSIPQMRDAMRRGYADLIAFAQTEGFQRLVMELFARPHYERPSFVKAVVLNPSELAKRDISVPEGILIQRSSFGDRRPTLFCIKKFLPKHLQIPWQNVNLTVDDIYDDDAVPRDRRAWRSALHFDMQAEMMGAGLTAEEMCEA
jgi:hypothetical protein